MFQINLINWNKRLAIYYTYVIELKRRIAIIYQSVLYYCNEIILLATQKLKHLAHGDS